MRLDGEQSGYVIYGLRALDSDSIRRFLEAPGVSYIIRDLATRIGAISFGVDSDIIDSIIEKLDEENNE